MLQCAGTERKAATCSRAVMPQVAWTEWSTIDPAMSMSQRNGVSELGGVVVGSGVSGWVGVGSGWAGGPVTSAGKVVASVEGGVAGASNSGKIDGGASLRGDTVRGWGRGTRAGSGTHARRRVSGPRLILGVGCGLGTRHHSPRTWCADPIERSLRSSFAW